MDNSKTKQALILLRQAKKDIWNSINNETVSKLFPEYKNEGLEAIIKLDKLTKNVIDEGNGNDSSDGRGRYLQGYIDALNSN